MNKYVLITDTKRSTRSADYIKCRYSGKLREFCVTGFERRGLFRGDELLWKLARIIDVTKAVV